ncbi:hypothetical protein MHYP_G00108200 [Metynnis hypsauchen]
MVMALKWILILCLYITGPAQAVDLSEASFVSATPGEAVTLHCKFVEQFAQNNWVWYKQRAGQEPQEVALKLPDKRKAALLSDKDKTRFKIHQNFSLTIEQTTKDDEGMYFCGKEDKETITFSHGTFLAVTEGPLDPVVLCLGAALGVCVVVISAQAFIIWRKQQGSSAENTTSQTAESLNYAPIHFKENKPKPGRVKREQPEDIVYSQVRSSNAKAHRSHR